jgi:glucose/arabinose dehydrogenase
VRRLGACALSLALLLTVGGCGAGKHAQRQRSGLRTIGAGLQGPEDLRASVYARGPLTLAGLAFDPSGRLWAAAAGLSTHTADGVYVIASPGASAVKVIAGLDDPLGLLWRAGRLYVSSVGRVDAYWGFDGRRFHSHRTILRGPVAGGENNDLALAPDGRLLMGVTATCDHCEPRSPLSGSIVSFRPDGSDLRIFARRIRAPFGLAFLPGGSELLVSMNQRDDLGVRTPGDWLAFVKRGQDWRFPGCYGQPGAACDGVPRPLAVLDKHAAAGSVVILGRQLGAALGTAALVAEWQTGKVLRVSLAKSGATYSGALSTLLTGVRNPLAMALAPQRSLLVGDWATGTIYRIEGPAEG